MWYTPWAFQKYETQEAESRDSEREQRKKMFKEQLRETRVLLQCASIERCRPLKWLSKEYITDINVSQI